MDRPLHPALMTTLVLYALLMHSLPLAWATNLSDCENWSVDDCFSKRDHPKQIAYCYNSSIPGQFLLCKDLCGWDLQQVGGTCRGYCPEFIEECLSTPKTSSVSPTADPPAAVTSQYATSALTTPNLNTAISTTTPKATHSQTMVTTHQTDLVSGSTYSSTTSEHKKEPTGSNSGSTDGLPDIKTAVLIVFGVIILLGAIALVLGFNWETFKRRIRCSCFRRKKNKIDDPNSIPEQGGSGELMELSDVETGTPNGNTKMATSNGHGNGNLPRTASRSKEEQYRLCDEVHGNGAARSPINKPSATSNGRQQRKDHKNQNGSAAKNKRAEKKTKLKTAEKKSLLDADGKKDSMDPVVTQ